MASWMVPTWPDTHPEWGDAGHDARRPVADLRHEDVAPFVRALGEAYYADAEMIREAIAQERLFNLFHFESMFKLDVHCPIA
jgi:hypothetical protein